VPTDPEEEVETLQIPGLLDDNIPADELEAQESEMEESEELEDDSEVEDNDGNLEE
jgi:hypothetical protein